MTTRPVPAVAGLVEDCEASSLVKTHPGISIVSHGVGPGLFEHALDGVGGAGDVAGTFQIGEGWGEEGHEEDNDTDDEDELDQREGRVCVRAEP